VGARIEATEVKQQTPDWPADGAIDLNVHDLPHASSSTEWWYTNGHCVLDSNRSFAYFAAFFRKVVGYHAVTRAPRYTHSLTWAIYDLDGQRTTFVSRVDASASQEGLRRIRAGLGARDARLNRALSELLERGVVPQPDMVFQGPVLVSQQTLELDYAGDVFRKASDGSYSLTLFDKRHSLGCELQIVPKKLPVRHGHNGVVRGPEDESLFYYLIPRCDVTGQIIYQGVRHAIKHGQGWYDHEFGSGVVDELDPGAEAALGKAACEKLQTERRARWEARQVGWNWISAQFDDASELSYYPEQYVYSGKSAGEHALAIAADGAVQRFSSAKLEPIEWWQSSQTFVEYPVRWRLQVPEAGLDLDVRAALHDQEIITLIAKSSFYEGRVELKGTRHGRPISGVGFVERSGIGMTEDMGALLDQVGKLVRRKVETLVPEEPTFAEAAYLLTAPDKPHYMQGVDVTQYARAHLKPIRTIVDRGSGTSDTWCSYAMQACISVVGGNARELSGWVAVPELLQTGALMLSDLEHKVSQTRGGPAAHVLFGEAQAINSGTAAFFLGAPLLRDSNLSDRQIVALYELYFDGLRAGHAGQALDLDGFTALMQRAVESDEQAKALVSRVQAVHRLKTGVPAGCLARIGALAGGGTTQQVEALGRFFEDIAQAFQIIDEVLQLRRDNAALNRITLPIAQGMTRLRTAERRWLFETTRNSIEKPQDAAVLERVVEALEGCGALDACTRAARSMGENAWAKVSPLLDDSLAKVMLRAFSLYSVERKAS
jgi:predicted secreted hydrolase/geranylgeranyl pyrophosphate synthase